jgi:hypothetical protein
LRAAAAMARPALPDGSLKTWLSSKTQYHRLLRRQATDMMTNIFVSILQVAIIYGDLSSLAGAVGKPSPA